MDRRLTPEPRRRGALRLKLGALVLCCRRRLYWHTGGLRFAAASSLFTVTGPYTFFTALSSLSFSPHEKSSVYTSFTSGFLLASTDSFTISMSLTTRSGFLSFFLMTSAKSAASSSIPSLI